MNFFIFNQLPDKDTLNGILQLHELIFQTSSSYLVEEINKKEDLVIVVAKQGSKIVGYKIGHKRKTNRFYSWLGGVDPSYRNQGIGSELMKLQHEWCKENCYESIRIHTKNKWRSMLILNLRHGFDIIGTLTDELGEPKIILEKKL
jgi:ribosomal protein S18 acetylase RimI-like enzyme